MAIEIALPASTSSTAMTTRAFSSASPLGQSIGRNRHSAANPLLGFVCVAVAAVAITGLSRNADGAGQTIRRNEVFSGAGHGTHPGARRFRRATMKPGASSRGKRKDAPVRRGNKPEETNRGTTDEFEREGMGIAPKE